MQRYKASLGLFCGPCFLPDIGRIQAHLHCSQTACRACCPVSVPKLPAAVHRAGNRDCSTMSLAAPSADVHAASDHLKHKLMAKA